MIDQLKEVYIDGEFEMIDTANWLPKVMHQGVRQRDVRRPIQTPLQRPHSGALSIAAGPRVRIRLPPAVSPQTIGSAGDFAAEAPLGPRSAGVGGQPRGHPWLARGVLSSGASAKGGRDWGVLPRLLRQQLPPHRLIGGQSEGGDARSKDGWRTNRAPLRIEPDRRSPLSRGEPTWVLSLGVVAGHLWR